MIDELKPCPFCGSKNVELKINGLVQCYHCTACVVFITDELKKGFDPNWLTSAVENWNRRESG